MFDGSALPLKRTSISALNFWSDFRRMNLSSRIEAGVVGGEEDGVTGEAGAKLYTTAEDTLEVASRLNGIKGGRYLLAATFGNVHGVYKPGHVKLKPSILKNCRTLSSNSMERRPLLSCIPRRLRLGIERYP